VILSTVRAQPPPKIAKGRPNALAQTPGSGSTSLLGQPSVGPKEPRSSLLPLPRSTSNEGNAGTPDQPSILGAGPGQGILGKAPSAPASLPLRPPVHEPPSLLGTPPLQNAAAASTGSASTRPATAGLASVGSSRSSIEEGSELNAKAQRKATIGFVRDVRRMNVALTRGRYCCWVVGSARTLETNPDWADFIQYVRKEGIIVTVPRVDPFVRAIGGAV